MQSSLPSSNAPSNAPAAGLRRGVAVVMATIVRMADIRLVTRHPASGMRFRLRVISHRAFWLTKRGKTRRAMLRLASLAQPVDTAIDVGSGVGFWAQGLAQKIGGDGQVHAFEPCPEDRPFLHQNIRGFANATLINAALSNRVGKTGIANLRCSVFGEIKQVHTVTLDGYATQHGLAPDILRIGPGAHALPILQGGRKTIARARAIMVNVTQDQDVIFGLLETAGYDLSDASGAEITDPAQMKGPVFGTR